MNLYLDNIVYSLQTAGGISVYWYELSKRLLASDNKLCFIEEKEHHNIFRNELLIPAENQLQKSFPPVSIARYLPVSFAHKTDNALFHSSYYRTPSDKRLSSVVTVHDFTYERMKKGIKKYIHQEQKKTSLNVASGIICISEHTKQDMLALYPHLEKKQIAVIYNGVSDSFFPLQKASLVWQNEDNDIHRLVDKKYVLFIGSREAYKNFNFAVNIIQQLPDYHLAIVGGGKLLQEEISLLSDKLSNRWHLFSGIDNSKLNKLYNFARFLIYPSAYEGFGIPVIEAEKSGCPVIALHASSIPEITTNHRLLLHSLQPEECLQKIHELEKDRDVFIAEGFKNSSRYSWDKCYQETTSFYRTVLQK